MGTLTAADVGRVIVAVGTVGGVPTQFESAVVSITDSLHGVLTTPAPFTQATAAQMDLAHDDTAAIAHTMSVVGSGGTLVFPEGGCLTHTQTLAGQSPIGLGFLSVRSWASRARTSSLPWMPSQGSGGSQGLAHIHDLTFFVDGRIDATQPWQTINDSGTTAHAAMYRPIAMRTGVTNNPVAPGWFQGPGPNQSGAYNGVANITASSAVICIPSTETAPTVGETMVFPYLAVGLHGNGELDRGELLRRSDATHSIGCAANGSDQYSGGMVCRQLSTESGDGDRRRGRAPSASRFRTPSTRCRALNRMWRRSG